MTVDFRQLLESLPARAEPGRSLHEARLKNELRAMLEAHEADGPIQMLRITGEAPYAVTGYDVMLSTPHLLYQCFARWLPAPGVLALMMAGKLSAESLALGRLLPLRVELGPTHPDRAHEPNITVLDHRVCHPAVLGPALCYAERWDPTQLVAELLQEIAALLRFERAADLARPLNKQAGAWFAGGHKGFDLPLR